MIDGNMAIQVSPVLSEGEMKSFQDMFGRIANTITRASELDVKVTDLIHKVDDLSHSLEVAQARNTNLDEALLRVRTERDELSVRLSEERSASSEAKIALNNALEIKTLSAERITQLEKSLADSHTERDDAQFQVLTLTEELDKAKAALASIYAALGIKPQPEAPSVTKSEPVDIVAGSDTSYLNKTYPTPEVRSEPIFVQDWPGFQADVPKTDAVERRKVWQDDPEYSNNVWYEAMPNEYGYDQESEKRWHYADAKRS